jgi:Na+-translocating ferredoxin:NAD+ oxidoreductase RnfA subunit
MDWVTSINHMALVGGGFSLASLIVGFSVQRKRKAGIPPPYSGEMAALITVGIVGIALVVFGP